MIGIDTTAVIDLIKGDCDISRYGAEKFVLCDAVYFESLLGFHQKKQVTIIANGVTQIVGPFPPRQGGRVGRTLP